MIMIIATITIMSPQDEREGMNVRCHHHGTYTFCDYRMLGRKSKPYQIEHLRQKDLFPKIRQRATTIHQLTTKCWEISIMTISGSSFKD